MTQHQKILELARKRKKMGFTYFDCHKFCNWPHKRIRELEHQGYSFKRETVKINDVRALRLWLIDEPRV